MVLVHCNALTTLAEVILVTLLLLPIGCGRGSSTQKLIVDLQSGNEKEQLIAVRTLPGHKGKATEVVPALIAALDNKSSDIRWSAAIGLGQFGPDAKSALPALTVALQDPDARIREAAAKAIGRIDLNAANNDK